MGLSNLKSKFGYIHFLGILLILSCMLTAVCISLIAYIVETKEIPFNKGKDAKKESNKPIETVSKQKVAENTKKQNPEILFIHERRNEKILLNYYRDLKKQKAIIELEKKNIEEERKSLNEVQARSAFIQQSLLKTQQDIKNLLIQVKKEEELNIKRICDLVTTMNAQSGSKMLLQQDNQMVARVLYFLPKKKSALLIEQIINNNQEGPRMKEIYQILHKLTQKDLTAQAGENNG